MEQKKLFIGLALVIAVLALGIAYAAITTQTLNVAGNAVATASDDNFNVAFDGEQDVGIQKSATVGENVNSAIVNASTNGQSGTFSISGLDTEGEYVTLTFPIVNNSPDLAATISNITVTNSDNTKAWWDITADVTPKSLAANGGEASLAITVTLKDTPATDAEAPEGNFHVSFKADPA